MTKTARQAQIAQANYPGWWDVVIRCTPREARADAWEEMARQALTHAEWAGNPWVLADPIPRMVELPDLSVDPSPPWPFR